MQRLERPRLRERVLAAEKQLAAAANNVADVLDLELIRVGGLEFDALDAVVAAELDCGAIAVPRVVEEE